MTTFNGWSIFFAAVALLTSSVLCATDLPRLTVKVEPSQAIPGERIHVQLRLSGIPETDSEEIAAFINDKMLDQDQKILVLDRSFHKDETVYVWEYQITTHRNENIHLPPFEVQFGANSFSTEAQEISIGSERKNGDDTIRPDYDALPLPIRWEKWRRLLAIALGIAGLFYAIRKIQSKLKSKPKTAPTPAIPVEHPLVWFQKEFSVLKAKAQSQTASINHLDELCKLVRTYYGKETQSPVETWTTHEFKTKFHKDNTAQRVVEIFEKMDRLRFVPTGDSQISHCVFECLSDTERTLIPWTI